MTKYIYDMENEDTCPRCGVAFDPDDSYPSWCYNCGFKPHTSQDQDGG